jgi:hypothetical protein
LRGRSRQPNLRRYLAALNRSAPSLTEVGAGCTSDQHTAAVLIEIGISKDGIAEWKQQKIIGL